MSVSGSKSTASEPLDDLVDAERGGVEHDGVLGLAQRVDGAGRVEPVAPLEIGGGRGLAGRGFAAAAARALGGVGGEVHLQVCVRRHDRADVAALDHNALGGADDRPLLGDEQGAHGRDGRDRGDRSRHLGPADLPVHADPVDADVRLGGVGADRDLDVFGHGGDLDRVAQVDVVAQHRVGHRAVHRAGVQVTRLERLGHAPRDRGLARAGRPVDGNHKLPALVVHARLLTPMTR
jgi:hypothetical protein